MICIGIDIAKRSHVASAVDEDGGTVVESFKFDNTANGFAKMLKRLRKADATPENSLVGMEATGRYWVALFDFLSSHGYEAAVINPVQTDAFRDVWTVRKVKTDALDAAMIADLVRYKRYSPSALGDEATEELRNLARYRLSLVERSTALKNRATAILDRTFPELAGLFSNAYCPTRRELLHPLVRTEAQVADCPFVAVYPGTDGLPASRHASCAHAALAFADQLVDPLPPELLTRYRMPAKAQAVRGIHAPKNADDLAAARRRLIFEELYLLQIGIFLLRSHGRRKTSAPMHPLDLGPFWRSLPYPPTGAQKRSTEEILADLCGDVPMNRLLQGDVGSGKTLVAAAAIWFAAQNGWQSAMLAPTEILARQHAATLADRLEPFGVNVTLLVGGMKAKEKRIALEAIADGRANLVVGTHAVLTDTVEFKNLGLAIVDEQHRFGVRQRGLLAGKAQSPHLLVMSATPIPRTLGLLMYGDLDISVLDELPPGRKPIKTWFITGKKRRDMYGFLDKQIAAGHQVYIVCPAIEENEAMGDLQAVTTYYTETACALLPNRRIGLLHGKLKPKEKDDVMQRFKAGELDVLVSTTVIEVGVDVPNATVMVIENAERFGLSALHQLRGRVGRGAADSCCILISDNGNDAVRERLQFLCRTSDGFAVAKYDLETRGPGDFFGSAQHGLPTLRVADLVQDTRTLRVAQDEAKALLAKDPNLIDPAHRALSDEVERLFETAGAMN